MNLRAARAACAAAVLSAALAAPGCAPQTAGVSAGPAGEVEELRKEARRKAATTGLASAGETLARIAAEGGAEEVFLTIHDLGGDKVLAMWESHPAALRGEDFHAYVGVLLLRRGDALGAVKAVEEGLAERPSSVRLLMLRTYLAEVTEDDFGSVDLARRLAEAAGTDYVTAVVVYASWLRDTERWHPLLPRAEDFAVDSAAVPDTARLDAGLFFLRHGDPETAVAALERMPVGSELWPEAVGMQVLALRTLDDAERVLSLLDGAIAAAPLDEVPGLAQMRAGEVEDARGPDQAFDFLDGLERAGDDPDVLYAKSLYAERSGMIGEAEDALRGYIDARPDESDGYNALGYLFADHNINLEEALSLIEHALSIEPDSAPIIDSHGWVLFRLGDLDAARERIEESLRLMGAEPHVEVLAHYGEVLWELGERETAVAVWTRAWQIDSEDEYLAETIGRFGQRLPELGE